MRGSVSSTIVVSTHVRSQKSVTNLPNAAGTTGLCEFDFQPGSAKKQLRGGEGNCTGGGDGG